MDEVNGALLFPLAAAWPSDASEGGLSAARIQTKPDKGCVCPSGEADAYLKERLQNIIHTPHRLSISSLSSLDLLERRGWDPDPCCMWSFVCGGRFLKHHQENLFYKNVCKNWRLGTAGSGNVPNNLNVRSNHWSTSGFKCFEFTNSKKLKY